MNKNLSDLPQAISATAWYYEKEYGIHVVAEQGEERVEFVILWEKLAASLQRYERADRSTADAEDAARYRWLKQHADTIVFDQEIALCRETCPIYVKQIGPADLDEATDYGRRAPGKSGESP